MSYSAEQRKAALKNWVKREFPNHHDQIDTEAEFDSTLTFSELKSELMRKFSILKEPNEKDTIKEARAELSNRRQIEKQQQEQARERQEAETEKALREAAKTIVSAANIEEYYTQYFTAIDLVVHGSFNALYAQSKSGMGKSYQTTSYLNKQEQEYALLAGNISDAYLYRFLCENNGKIIVIRDVSKLLQSQRCIDLLKSATETHGARVIKNLNYSKHSEDLPEALNVTSRFIFEFNSLPIDNAMRDDIEALLSRGYYLNLTFSFEQICDIMRKIAANEKEKETTEYLIANYNYVGSNGFNLRTQQKAFKVREHAAEKGTDWQQEIKTLFAQEMSYIRRGLYSLIGDKPIRTKDLKRLLLLSHFDNVANLRTADRRIHEWVEIGELSIVGLSDNSEENVQRFLASNRNFAVSING